jgi:hypothetical protein
VAAVVPLEQYRLTETRLRALEDRVDVERMRAALADNDPSAWTSVNDFRKELGLDGRPAPRRKKGSSKTPSGRHRKTAHHHR